MRFKQRLIGRWHRIPEKKRESFLKSLGTILNYLFNGILLAIPAYIFAFLFFHSSIKAYFLLALALSVLLAFIENYYIFFRESWKDDYRR